jgi:hypothetical protein
VQPITRDQFLQIVGITSGAFDQMQHAGHVALAFGGPLPAVPGRYFGIDCVAMAIALGLAPFTGRDHAAAIVAGFFNQWGTAVAYAEADPQTNFFMAIGGVRWDPVRKRSQLMLVTNGTLEQIAKDFEQIGGLVGAIHVNITDIIQRIRVRSRELGIGIEQPFFLPPNHPAFEKIITQVKNERDTRIARLRRDKKKSRVSEARKRHAKEIKAVPRVQALDAYSAETAS